MRIRTIITILAAIGLLAVFAVAADITGKWKAETTGRDGQTRTTTFNFKVDGSKLTGTVSGRMGDTEITEGKIDGDAISFVVMREFQGEQRKIQYKGKVVGEEIKLSVQFGPDMPPREMVAKRAKD